MNWKAPKSVRQIGDIKGKTKIYVEDYVTSFARQIARERTETESGGVLLGHRFYHAGERIFLISGMVSIRDFEKRTSDTFSQEMWTGIYTDMKENYTDLDVVGWYYTGKGERTGNLDRLLEIHRRNFAEGDKLLYIYGEKSQADDFYLYENGSFLAQKGYYIYYEKNPEMRQYMMDEANRFVHIVEQEDDRVIRNIRGVIRENEERKKGQEAENKWGVGLAGLVVLLGLVLAMTVIQNQNGMAELKKQIKGLQTAIMGNGGNETTVQTLGGGVVSGQAVSSQAVNGEPDAGSASLPADAGALPLPASGTGISEQ